MRNSAPWRLPARRRAAARLEHSRQAAAQQASNRFVIEGRAPVQTVLENITANDLIEGLPSRVHEVYAKFAQEIPEHPAFVEAGRSWSYRQFSDAVEAAARDLRELQVRPGDRVMVASENSVALGAILFAIGKLDAWAIAVNPRLSARELEQIRSHSGARLVIFNSALSKEAADHAVAHRRDHTFDRTVRRLGRRAVERGARAEPVETDAARQVAALMYTSGTTGAPKGVMLSHRNLLVAAKTSGILRNSGPADRIYGVLPMSHIVGYSILLVATLMHGATLHVVAESRSCGAGRSARQGRDHHALRGARHLSAFARIQGRERHLAPRAWQPADDVRGGRAARPNFEAPHGGRVRHPAAQRLRDHRVLAGPCRRAADPACAGRNAWGPCSRASNIELSTGTETGWPMARSANCMFAVST